MTLMTHTYIHTHTGVEEVLDFDLSVMNTRIRDLLDIREDYNKNGLRYVHCTIFTTCTLNATLHVHYILRMNTIH